MSTENTNRGARKVRKGVAFFYHFINFIKI